MICLLPHCGYLSETSRMLAIRRALVARGARVCVATHGGTHERLLGELGVSRHQSVFAPISEKHMLAIQTTS